jgi:aspartate oxidase
MQRHTPLGELGPRDEVARAIYEEMIKRGECLCILRSRLMQKYRIKRRFPCIYENSKSMI